MELLLMLLITIISSYESVKVMMIFILESKISSREKGRVGKRKGEREDGRIEKREEGREGKREGKEK